MRLRIVLVVLVLLAAITSLAVAQITTATLSGTIKDETGGVLPGVDIVVTNLETGLMRSTVSDSQGYAAEPREFCGPNARGVRWSGAERNSARDRGAGYTDRQYVTADSARDQNALLILKSQNPNPKTQIPRALFKVGPLLGFGA